MAFLTRELPVQTSGPPDDLHIRCERNGLAVRYTNFRGEIVQVPDTVLSTLLTHVESGSSTPGQATGTLPVRVLSQAGARRLCLPAGDDSRHWRLTLEHGGHLQGLITAGVIDLPESLPLGYHRLEVGRSPVAAEHACSGWASGELIIVPERCFEPPQMADGGRHWGLTLQLYALRSQKNWGIGDFGDLQAIVQMAGEAGASFVGLNPLHAMFAGDPGRRSPYSPSSRQFLNVIYLSVESVPEFKSCLEARRLVSSVIFQSALRGLRESTEVDYPSVGRLKLVVLALLYLDFQSRESDENDGYLASYEEFVRLGSSNLNQHATFEASSFIGDGWPNMGTPTAWLVDLLKEESILRIREVLTDPEFHLYLQWQAGRQLRSVTSGAGDYGLSMGLYLDVAVGASPDGSEVSATPHLYAQGLHVGTPSEEFNPLGQDWGFPPLIPRRLREAGYRPFVELLRANMRHAGVIRIDHAMALQRLFCVVPGAGACSGSYLSYDLDALLGITALESHRNQCMVVGEALGTVPEGFLHRLAGHGVLSYSVLFFERAGARFLAPDEWPEHAFGVVRTHDHPTFPAWWQGDDITIRGRFGWHAGEAHSAREHRERENDKKALWRALADQDLIDLSLGSDPQGSPAPVDAVHAFVARAGARLVGVALEDILRQTSPINVPGTTEDQHPNWCVKLPTTLESLREDPRWQSVASMFHVTRPSVPAHIRGGRYDSAFQRADQ